MKYKFLSYQNMPPRLGPYAFMVWYLFLDHVAAPGWVQGPLFTLLAVAYGVELFRFAKGEVVELQ